MTQNFFLCKYLAYHNYVQYNVEKFKKNLKLSFFGPSSALFCHKSASWTANELAGDDIENCKNSQLTLTNLSHLL